MIQKVEMKSEVKEDKPGLLSYKPSAPVIRDNGITFRQVFLDVNSQNYPKNEKGIIESEYYDTLSDLMETMALMS